MYIVSREHDAHRFTFSKSAPSDPKPRSCIVRRIASTSVYHAPVAGTSSCHCLVGRLAFCRSAAHVRRAASRMSAGSAGVGGREIHTPVGRKVRHTQRICEGRPAWLAALLCDRRAQALPHDAATQQVIIPLVCPLHSCTRCFRPRLRLADFALPGDEPMYISRSH